MKQFNSLLVILLCLGLSFQLSAQERYLESVFDEVQVTKDITYSVNTTVLFQPNVGEAVPEELKLDFYEPVGDTLTERPIVLIFHTGNFLPQELNGSIFGTREDSVVVELATRFAQMGYVAASVDYRLGWNPTSELQPIRVLTLIQAAYRGVQDARTAIRFFKKDFVENGNSFGVDTSRITLWGVGTGGYITLPTSSLDDFNKIAMTQNPPGKFLTDLDGDPSDLEVMVNQAVHGDINGTTLGVVPEQGYLEFPPGDTLNIPNHVGYSSDFQLTVNMGGALGDLAWMDAGQTPVMGFHVPEDPFAPYEDAVLVVPTTNDPVVQVQGSKLVVERANELGNNQVFIDANIDDPYTQAARNASDIAGHEYFEGLFPINRPPNPLPGGNPEGSPWNWWNVERWDSVEIAPGVSFHQAELLDNPDMSPEKGRTYLDSIIGYFAPRAFAALELGESTSVEEVLNNERVDLQISPNPATNRVRFRSGRNYPMQDIEIYDLNGRLLRAQPGINAFQYDLLRKNLASGVYVAKVRFKEGVVSQKIILK